MMSGGANQSKEQNARKKKSLSNRNEGIKKADQPEFERKKEENVYSKLSVTGTERDKNYVTSVADHNDVKIDMPITGDTTNRNVPFSNQKIIIDNATNDNSGLKASIN